ncbi:MAG: PDZ domain-containing protein, partial [Thermoprotei archaeon]
IEQDLGHVENLGVSPTKTAVIVSNNRFELLYVDLESGSAKVLDKSEYGIIEEFDWHPGGEWVAYTFPESQHATSIKMANVSTGVLTRVTSPAGSDFSPSFDPDGSYLYYLSRRYLDPVYDKIVFDLGFPKAAKPFLAALRKDVVSPFTPVPRPPPTSEADKEKEKERGKEGSGSGSPRVEVDGLTERLEPFPVDEADYTKIVGVKGRALFLSFPVEGATRHWFISGSPRANGIIESYDIKENSKETFLAGVSDFKASADRSTLAVRVGDKLRVLSAAGKPDERAPPEPGRRSGWVDLTRVKALVSPPAEWGQMLRETWRMMRENYWREDLRGVDWPSIYTRYSKLLPKLSTRSELSDLIREMQGELGTSHAYEMGGDYGSDEGYPVGSLGADFEFNGEGYTITKIHVGDAANEGEKSPLVTAGVDIKAGDVLLAINGEPLSRTSSPQTLLVNRAGEPVLLKVKRGSEVREFTVTTLRDERKLLYREWVESNRRYVHQKTGGKIGYVHIPDMGPWGYAEFHRLYPHEADKQGLIVDVRYNGGGHVSMLILEKIARKVIGYEKPRRGKLVPYPQDAVRGPVVAVTNEQAGSDGDIFSHAFKLMGLGPLIGTRTWGGVVGINPRTSLVDGTYVTQPQYAFWFKDVGWGVENYGTDPTIEVENAPQDYAAGTDPQLDRAIEESLKLLAQSNILKEPV